MIALVLVLAVGAGGMGADAASAASTRPRTVQLEARAALVPLAAVMVCIRVCPAAGVAAARILRRTPKQIRHLPAPKPAYAKAFSDAAGGSSASRALRGALVKQNPLGVARSIRQGYHAHHIVAHGHPRAEFARMVLQMRGIQPNDAVNGVWLRPAVHPSSHSMTNTDSPDPTRAKGDHMRADRPDLAGLTWRKSTLSADQGECVETARLPDRRVAVRHSKDPAGGVLLYTPAEWRAFVGGVKRGEFDLP